MPSSTADKPAVKLRAVQIPQRAEIGRKHFPPTTKIRLWQSAMVLLAQAGYLHRGRQRLAACLQSPEGRQ